MARTGLRMVIAGTDALRASLESIGEAFDNVHIEDIEIELSDCLEPMGVTANGMRIASFSAPEFEREAVVCRLKPAPGMIPFVDWLMTILPSRATVTWVDGWPHVHCPPNDDRDVDDGPTPLVPSELVPA